MALLQLEHVWKRYPRGERGVCERVAVRDVSLEVGDEELVAVVGRRRSGRTSLLQVAAGIEAPSQGTARFAGVDLAERSSLDVPEGIAYCLTTFKPVLGDTVLEQVVAPRGSRPRHLRHMRARWLLCAGWVQSRSTSHREQIRMR